MSGDVSFRATLGTELAALQPDFPLARLTTVRTGGNAEFFARAGSVELVQELLQWAQSEGHAVAIVGSGSNLLIADEGVSGLVMKLEGALTKIEQHGTKLWCGGGMRLPAAAAFAARAGLSGLEFGVNIPGTVGGAVRMNANAYGGLLEECLEWVDVVTVGGVERRTPADFNFVYRNSNLKNNEVVVAGSFALSEAEPAAVKATLAEMRAKRHAAQPSGIKTFGSTFKNPQDPRAEGRTAGLLLNDAGCRGLQVGGARFSEKHANFVENLGEATTNDIVALMDAGYTRVHSKFGVALEPEVQVLGQVSWPHGSWQ